MTFLSFYLSALVFLLLYSTDSESKGGSFLYLLQLKDKKMSGLIKEWTAIQQFPAATQEKLVDLLSKLKNQVYFFALFTHIMLQIHRRFVK